MENIKRKKKTCDWVLVVTVLLLTIIGFFMVYSSSYPDGLYKFGDSLLFLRTQVTAGVIGIIGMFVLSFIPYGIYKYFYKIIPVVCAILSIATLIMGFSALGAQRWINIGGFSLQPSEIIKLGAVLFFADFFNRRRDKSSKFWEGFGFSMLIMGLFVGLIVIQQDLSTSIALMVVLILMFFCAGAKIKHLLLLVLLGICVVVVMIAMYPYRIGRITIFLDPYADPLGLGFQIIQSLYALGTGGLFGLGLGNSRQKFFYLPEAYNDYIFSIIGEELGFIGCLFVILLFVIFAWRGVRIALNSKDLHGSLIAIGITALVCVQFLMHVAVATSSMPPTGRALPFISAGGTALTMLLASVGILLNISRSADVNNS